MTTSISDNNNDIHIIKIQSCFKRYKWMKELKLRKKMVAKRKNVANELLHTEREYTSNLHILAEKFLKPALTKSNAKILNTKLENEFSLSLSGIDVIYKFHSTLLIDLEEKITNWNPSSELGALFLPMAFYLKSYSSYVNHYQNVVQLLAKRKTDKSLQNMLFSLKPQAAGKGIKDYLIMPVQRIPRYQMLLFELVKSTWESHSDYQNLVSAQAKVQEVAVDLENRGADAASIAKVVELSSTFSRKDNFKLLLPHRRYVDDIVTNVVFSESNNPLTLTLYLFNDILIWAKVKKDKSVIKQTIYLEKVNIINEEDSNSFIFKDKVSSDILLTTSIEKDSYTKWSSYIKSIVEGKKVWLPHEEKEEGEIITIKKENILPPPPPPLPKKKRSIFGKFIKEFASKEDVRIGIDKDDSVDNNDSKAPIISKKRNSLTKETIIQNFDSNENDYLENPVFTSSGTDLESSNDSPVLPKEIETFNSVLVDIVDENINARRKNRAMALQLDCDTYERPAITSPNSPITDYDVRKNRDSVLNDIKSLDIEEVRSKRAEVARSRLEKMKELSQKTITVRDICVNEIKGLKEEDTDEEDCPKPSNIASKKKKIVTDIPSFMNLEEFGKPRSDFVEVNCKNPIPNVLSPKVRTDKKKSPRSKRKSRNVSESTSSNPPKRRKERKKSRSSLSSTLSVSHKKKSKKENSSLSPKQSKDDLSFHSDSVSCDNEDSSSYQNDDSIDSSNVSEKVNKEKNLEKEPKTKKKNRNRTTLRKKPKKLRKTISPSEYRAVSVPTLSYEKKVTPPTISHLASLLAESMDCESIELELDSDSDIDIGSECLTIESSLTVSESDKDTENTYKHTKVSNFPTNKNESVETDLDSDSEIEVGSSSNDIVINSKSDISKEESIISDKGSEISHSNNDKKDKKFKKEHSKKKLHKNDKTNKKLSTNDNKDNFETSISNKTISNKKEPSQNQKNKKESVIPKEIITNDKNNNEESSKNDNSKTKIEETLDSVVDNKIIKKEDVKTNKPELKVRSESIENKPNNSNISQNTSDMEDKAIDDIIIEQKISSKNLQRISSKKSLSSIHQVDKIREEKIRDMSQMDIQLEQDRKIVFSQLISKFKTLECSPQLNKTKQESNTRVRSVSVDVKPKLQPSSVQNEEIISKGISDNYEVIEEQTQSFSDIIKRFSRSQLSTTFNNNTKNQNKLQQKDLNIQNTNEAKSKLDKVT